MPPIQTDNRRSLFVALAKRVLPLLALVLLSTVFLFGRKIEPGSAIPYSDVDIEALARESRLTTPDYSGVTDDGSALSARATTAVPDFDGDGSSEAENLVAKLVAPDGGVTDLSSRLGRILPDAARIELTRDVAVETSDGFRMLSDYVEMGTRDGSVSSPGPVSGSGPMGTLEAGAMEIHRPARGSAQNFLFTGGVKLVYQPGTKDQ